MKNYEKQQGAKENSKTEHKARKKSRSKEKNKKGAKKIRKKEQGAREKIGKGTRGRDPNHTNQGSSISTSVFHVLQVC